jgi:putative ABC transport system permease protein
VTDVAIALVLVAVALVLSRVERIGVEKDLLVAVVRAIAQLAAIALIVRAVLSNLGLAALLLVVMVVIASWTSSRRLAGVPRSFGVSAVAICAGSIIALVVLFGLGAFDLDARFLIPIAGMLIGNCMTGTSLAGVRLRDEIVDKSLEVEARLALGVSARDALATYRRRAAATSLIPTIDSTKNVGIIFLPGTFVGMILGGASPIDAAQVQLVVLFMLLGAVCVSAVTATRLVAAAFVGPGERLVLPAEVTEDGKSS